MASDDPGTLQLTVLADHYQFYLQDLAAHGTWMRSHGGDPGLAPAGWTKEAVYDHRIGVEPFSLAVGTADDGTVEVLLSLAPARPAVGPADAEHIVEADLGLPGGDLAISGPADDPGSEQHVPVAPGSYRVRVSYRRTHRPGTTVNGSAPVNDFRYEISLWPVEAPAPLAVLKQGPRQWA